MGLGEAAAAAAELVARRIGMPVALAIGPAKRIAAPATIGEVAKGASSPVRNTGLPVMAASGRAPSAMPLVATER